MTASDNRLPLEGIVVLDVTRVLAGPFAGLVLRELGARVIKVEKPLGGDDARNYGPFKNGVSGYFISVNKGKEGLALNLKHPEGKKLFIELVKQADVLVENNRPGVMEKLGLAYKTLASINPRLIYLAISGYGQSGPYSTRPAYDMIIQAMSGIMSITGPEEGLPVRVGSSISDLAAALFGVIGVLAKLYQREHSRKGGLVDVAMYDSSIALLENAIVRTHLSGNSPQPLGTRHPSITPFQAFTTQDGLIVIAIGNDTLWEKFCLALETPELIHDERFRDNDKRTRNHSELEEILNLRLSTKTTADWLDILERKSVPCSPVQDISSMMTNPQTLARNMLQTLTHPLAGQFTTAGFPVKMENAPHSVAKPAPDLGEDTRNILKEMLNLEDDQIAALKKMDIIYYP